MQPSIGDDVPPELLGYRADPRWRDMSNYLVHFTDTPDRLGSMLADGFIRPGGPFGWGRKFASVAAAHQSVCMSEIPLDMMDRLIGQHGHYGLGFRREFVTRAGGARVWYLDQDGPASQALFDRIGTLLDQQDFDDDLWKLTPFIDLVMPGRYSFEWEREWRVPGGLTFELGDVALVITPDGDRHLIDQNPNLYAPIVSSDDGTAWWLALPQALGDAVDARVAHFLTVFSDPVNHLPWDEGEYVWYVEQWTTDDAIAWLFDPIEYSVAERMAYHLNNISGYWVRIAELDDFGR